MSFHNPAAFFDPLAARIMRSDAHHRPLPVSNMFTIRRQLETFRERHPNTQAFDASQGDGGASLGGVPVDELTDALQKFLPKTQTTAYGQPGGDLRLREALLFNFWKLSRQGYTPDNIIVCDGGRDALQKWYQALRLESGRQGHNIIVSNAPWISYAHGSYLNGMNLVCAPACTEGDFKITPRGLDAAIRECGQAHALIITTPDNPTGTCYTQQEILTLIDCAYANGIKHVLIDLMYQLVVDDDVELYDWDHIMGALPQKIRACVDLLDGLTKSVGASNVRMAHLVISDMKRADTIRAIASHTTLPNVLGEAAGMAVYASPTFHRGHPWITRITKPTSESRRVFRTEMSSRGFRFVADQGYYGFINVSPWIDRSTGKDKQFTDTALGAIKMVDATDIASYLGTQHGIAVVPGTPFRQPSWVRFSYAQKPETTRAAIERFDAALKSLF